WPSCGTCRAPRTRSWHSRPCNRFSRFTWHDARKGECPGWRRQTANSQRSSRMRGVSAMKLSTGITDVLRKQRLLGQEIRLRLLNGQVNELAEYAFTDGEGRPLQQADVHRDLQDFLTRHERALIELPRDHGKSVQICIRVLWELGQRPGL